MTKQRYVYKNTEVILTGRYASRINHRTFNRRSDNTQSHEYLHEVTPADPSNGSWTSWVNMNELYEIVENVNESIS